MFYGVDTGILVDFCRQERDALNEAVRKAARDSDSVTSGMRDDIMQLLTLFGLPFMVSAPVMLN